MCTVVGNSYSHGGGQQPKGQHLRSMLHGLVGSRDPRWHLRLLGLYLLVHILLIHGLDPLMDSSRNHNKLYLGPNLSRPTRQLQIQLTSKLQCILLVLLLRMQIGTWTQVLLLTWHPYKLTSRLISIWAINLVSLLVMVNRFQFMVTVTRNCLFRVLH